MWTSLHFFFVQNPPVLVSVFLSYSDKSLSSYYDLKDPTSAQTHTHPPDLSSFLPLLSSPYLHCPPKHAPSLGPLQLLFPYPIFLSFQIATRLARSSSGHCANAIFTMRPSRPSDLNHNRSNYPHHVSLHYYYYFFFAALFSIRHTIHSLILFIVHSCAGNCCEGRSFCLLCFPCFLSALSAVPV